MTETEAALLAENTELKRLIAELVRTWHNAGGHMDLAVAVASQELEK